MAITQRTQAALQEKEPVGWDVEEVRGAWHAPMLTALCQAGLDRGKVDGGCGNAALCTSTHLRPVPNTGSDCGMAQQAQMYALPPSH